MPVVSEMKLLPCPFCGESAALKIGIHTQYVMCLGCETMGPNLAKPAECIDAWNRRLTAALSDQVALPRNGKPAFWTHDAEAAKTVGHVYYFAPTDRAKPPYRTQRHVTAIIDIADDGTLAGVELIEGMPPPPSSPAAGE